MNSMRNQNLYGCFFIASEKVNKIRIKTTKNITPRKNILSGESRYRKYEPIINSASTTITNKNGFTNFICWFLLCCYNFTKMFLVFINVFRQIHFGVVNFYRVYICSKNIVKTIIELERQNKPFISLGFTQAFKTEFT